MGFFEETVSLAQETFDVIGKKTEEIVSVQKLKLQMKSAENKLNALYAELGRRCVEQFLNDSEGFDFARESVDKINEKKDEIERLRGDICRAKGGKCCSSCKTFNEPTSAFCKKCGSQI